MEALRKEIRVVKKDDPRMYAWAFRRGAPPLQLALAVVEGRSPLLAVLEYEFDRTKNPPELLVHDFFCPGDCKDGTQTYFLGQHAAIDALLATGARIPYSDLPDLMQREIADDPKHVGPPIVGMEITPAGRRWIAGEDFCSRE
jgi:hypothetical protein